MDSLGVDNGILDDEIRLQHSEMSLLIAIVKFVQSLNHGLHLASGKIEV